jgi:hypothetical protein
MVCFFKHFFRESVALLFFFKRWHWNSKELFFATQANWQYAQKGSDAARSWSDRSQYSSMLQRKSKGSRHRDRGIARGYSTTERAPRPRATAAAAAAGTHEPAASVPAAPVPAASEAASSVPHLALQKRSAFPSPAGARGPWHTPYAFVASGEPWMTFFIFP